MTCWECPMPGGISTCDPSLPRCGGRVQEMIEKARVSTERSRLWREAWTLQRVPLEPPRQQGRATP